MSIIQGTSKSSAAGYDIAQSIRFNDDDAAYLYRDVASAPTDGKKFTYSVWIKRGAISSASNCGLLSGGSGTSAGRCDLIFTAGAATGDGSNFDALKFDIYSGGFDQTRSLAKLRDPSAWYHIVFVFDAANATANDTMIMYLNGDRLELDSTSGVPNVAALVNANGQRTRIGADASNTPVEFDGYMAEINMIDGQALDPTSFGETNADTGQWVPIAYTGSYGTNGFYITGADSADLGADDSGNGNNFTSSGLTAADQVTDSPTDNYGVMNPLDNGRPSNITLSDGNLTAAFAGSGYSGGIRSSIFFDSEDSDGWYAECTLDSLAIASVFRAGVANASLNLASNDAQTSADGWAYSDQGAKLNNSYTTSYGSSVGVGDVVGIAVRNGKIYFAVNNTWQGSADPVTESNPAFSNLTGDVAFCQSTNTGGSYAHTATWNFGQTGFTYTPPTGYKSLRVQDLPDPTIADPSAYFQTTLYTGNASTQEVNQSGNSNFEPGLVWIKTRSNAASHALFDQVRGVNKQLRSDSTGTEYTAYSDLLTSFDADGFTLGADATVNNVNVNTYTYAAWQWAADGTSGSSNTDGSLTSTVSADTTSGFSIATYTGTGANATVGHGLGVAPSFVLVKSRNDTHDWYVWTPALATTEFLKLNSTAAKGTSSPEVWNSTAPTSSVVSLGTSIGVNRNTYNYVMYCFAEVEGFSKFGSFTGNGSSTDGPFIYTGFKPEFFMWKRTDSGTYGDWTMLDTKRDPFNMAQENLRANSTMAGDTGEANLDFVSNGIKHRGGTSARFNQSGATYVYMAFAESPFKTATAR